MISQYTSTNQLSSWAKRISNIEFNRIQTLSDGYVICCIFNHIYPNVINMHKINMKAKSNYEKQKNISVFFDAIFKGNLPNIHVNKKVDQKDQLSKSSLERLDKRRSQTCQPKNRQRSIQGSKIIKSNKVRQSKTQFHSNHQNSLTKDNDQIQEVSESLKKSSGKKQMNFNRLSQTKQCVLSNDKIPKKQMIKYIPEQTLQQELNDVIMKLDPQILRSKMIKVATCFSQNQDTKYKLRQILASNSNPQKEIVFQEQDQKQNIQQNQSETYFSIDNGTQHVQIDTAESLQLEKNQNLVKIQISPRYKKDNQIINTSSKENMLKNENVNQNNLEKFSMKQRTPKIIFQNNQNDKNSQRIKQTQMKVIKSMSGKKQKTNLQKETGQKIDQSTTSLSYPQLNPENKLQVQKPIFQTSIEKLSNDNLEI